MDSGNSGSIQSSSGGEEEYDSRAESISVFLNNNNYNNPLTHVGPMPNPPPQPPPNHQHHHQSSSSSMFDPLSSYFDPLSSSSSRSSPQFTNLDMIWSKTLRSDSTCTDLPGFMPPTQHFLTTTQNPPSRSNFPSIQIPQPQESGSGSATSDQTNPVRKPKKRSRASRRALTTVLTTDTTNFRAMVQEFTGIPAPPFTSSSFPRSRLDLFGSPTFRSLSHLDSPPPPPYLLRTFPQKIQPFLPSSSSMVDAIAFTTTTTTGSSYQLSSDLGHLKQNPVLNLHSLLQPSPKFPIFDTLKPQLEVQAIDSQLKMGALEDFGLSHGIQNMVPSSSDSHQGLLRSINANYSNSHSVSNNGKINYSASSSDFHGDKGSAIVATRTEGMMESWICSSD